MTDSGAHSRLSGLDVVRFSAALLVSVFHLFFWARQAGSDAGPPMQTLPNIDEYTWFGWIGVEIFFVLSGSVIALSASHSSPWRFIRGRALRLLPAAWLGGLMVFWIPAIEGFSTWEEQFQRLFGTMTLSLRGPWTDIIYWTLSIEIMFYALVSAMLLFRKFNYCDIIAFALSIWSGLFWLMWVIDLPELNHVIHIVAHSHTARLLLVRHGCFFALGMAAWYIASNRVSIYSTLAILIGLAGGIAEIWERSLDQQGITGSPIVAETAFIFAIICIYAAIFGVFPNFSNKTSSFITTLGLMTYPLYLIHNVSSIALMRVMINVGLPSYIVGGIALAFAICAAWVVTTLLEPALRKSLAFIIDRGISVRLRAPTP